MVAVTGFSRLLADEVPARPEAAASHDGASIAPLLQTHEALPKDGAGRLIEQIGESGDARALRRLWAQALGGGFTPEATARALNALAAGGARGALPAPEENSGRNVSPADRDGILRFLRMENPGIQAAAARLAGAWKVDDALDWLSQLAAAKEEEVRREAFRAIKSFGGETALRFLAVVVRPGYPEDIRRQALVAIAEISLDGAVMQSPDVFGGIESEADALALWRGLLNLNGAGQAFAVRLPRPLSPVVIAAGLQAAEEAGAPGKPLGKALAKESAKAAGR